MIFSLKYQFDLIIFSLAAGIITGIFFDIYRMIRGLKRVNAVVSFIEDILFWFFISIVIFIFMLVFYHAYLSVYVYFLIALGIYIYIKIFSKHFISFARKLISIINIRIRIIFKFIFYPANLLFYGKIKKNKNKNKK